MAYTLGTLAVGATCVIASWGLGPTDICLNMMPLFHVGGILRNLLSPVLAGGATVLAAGFDAVQFWDIAPGLGVTWCDRSMSGFDIDPDLKSWVS